MVSRREHGAREALFASEEYCYGDALQGLYGGSI
jgi:hypothetical protein